MENKATTTIIVYHHLANSPQPHCSRVCVCVCVHVLMSHASTEQQRNRGESPCVGLGNNIFNHFSYPSHQKRAREGERENIRKQHLFLHDKTTYLSVFLFVILLCCEGRMEIVLALSAHVYFSFPHRSRMKTTDARTTLLEEFTSLLMVLKTPEDGVGESLPFCYCSPYKHTYTHKHILLT